MAAKGEVRFPNTSAIFLTVMSMPNPRAAASIAPRSRVPRKSAIPLNIPLKKPTTLSLVSDNTPSLLKAFLILVPSSFIMLITFENPVLIPLTRPSIIFLPTSKNTVDGECIPKILLASFIKLMAKFAIASHTYLTPDISPLTSPSIMYFGILCNYGVPKLTTTFATLLGFLLFVMSYISFGMFASSITENQVIAAILTIGFFILTWFLPDFNEI